MLLTTDQQTLNDLAIFGRPGSDAIFNIYNRTATMGGAALLEEMFRHPLADAGGISQRSGIISHFAKQGSGFPFDSGIFDAAEQYLAERDERTRLTGQDQSLGQKLSDLISEDTAYKTLVKGILAIIELLRELQRFLSSEALVSCAAYVEERLSVMTMVSEEPFLSLLQTHPKGKYTREQLAGYDNGLRFRHPETVRKLLLHIYRLDVYISVAKVAIERGYVFPEVIPASADKAALLSLEDVKHPTVVNAKGNNILIDSQQNVVFLTGANMAGKSTFMKSIGIAMYIAHIGFPVAAKKMTFMVVGGFFSTINLPDNLGMGASHFYAEVLRVKKVSKELSMGKRLFVLFDELFRGTNVKDANEATIAVVEGFARKSNSLFLISTHIIEAGETLKTKSDHIQYRYLPTKMAGHKPLYTYKLEEGITEDRHGMVIIRNEGILDMLDKGKLKDHA
jgi:DNA mismatch repair protein MutS